MFASVRRSLFVHWRQVELMKVIEDDHHVEIHREVKMPKTMQNIKHDSI